MMDHQRVLKLPLNSKPITTLICLSFPIPPKADTRSMFFSRVAVAALSKRSLVAGSRFAAAPWVHNVCWLSTVPVPPPPTSNHFHKPLPHPGGTIIYTETDEAPALATFSLYPAVAKVCPCFRLVVVPCRWIQRYSWRKLMLILYMPNVVPKFIVDWSDGWY